MPVILTALAFVLELHPDFGVASTGALLLAVAAALLGLVANVFD
jgi:hypothetical protein